jgi:ABC-2 type transport system ATP-binding protein
MRDKVMNDVQNAIEIKGLTKTYAAQKSSGGKTTPPKTALDNVDLTIPKGSFFALLGPNGAGKSTMINILAGLVIKSQGDVKIWGHNIDDNVRMAKSSIGIVPQEINFDPFFTPRKLLDIQAGLYGVPKEKRRTEELLELVGLSDKAESYARSLSGGMQRRLMVAKAMVHTPPVLILDEPTAGVDVELRQNLWKNVRALNEQGTTILLTTHYLEEAEELCDRIAIINHGRIIADESKDSLLTRINGKAIRFRMEREFASVPESLAAMGFEKKGKQSLFLQYTPEETPVEKMISAIHAADFKIADIFTEEGDLEDIFLQLTRGDDRAA